MDRQQLEINTRVFINHVKENYIPNKPLVFWIDLFCGAGGTSTGIHLSNTKNVFVAACVNHDANAIKSHAENHPFTLHFTEDIKDFAVVENLKYLVSVLRKEFPECKVKIWASLECTNYSKAKGGQAKDADSRSLANHMPMYFELEPDSFWFENVEEFMSWGPMYIPEIKVKPSAKSIAKSSNDYTGEGGLACRVKFKKDKKTKEWRTELPWKPISKDKGKYYLQWVNTLKSLGYNYDFKILNSADYESYQSRKRLFIQFPKKGIPFVWPQATRSKNGSEDSLFPIPKWKAVKEILDLKDEGESIFTRKKPLSDKTIEVIIKGIVKAIEEEEKVFMFKYYGNGDNYNSINNPSGTVTTKDRFAKIQLIFNQYKNGSVTKMDRPIGALTTVPKCNLLTFILNPSHGGHTTSVNRPAPTVIARQDKAPLYILQTIMDEYGIVDVKYRLAKIPELLQMQGFPKDYKLIGTQTEQKKYIGNAVEVNMARALATADYELELKMAA